MDGMITLKFTANFFNLKRRITFFGEIILGKLYNKKRPQNPGPLD